MPGTTIPPLPFSTDELLSASPKDKAQLADIKELLDRLFVRNRNQHRRNHWFKSLWQFRKEMGRLMGELEGGVRGTGGGKKRKDGREGKEAAEKVERRLRYWDEECVHGWYL